ncbi:MAG: DUF4350 domain-containing protein [Bacteroidetes bacterium]|nr:MAG: DUF4350 domain-containing protein [Bacteroidota bacterium]
MKRDNLLFYIIGALVLILLTVFFFGSGKNYNWQEHYQKKGKDPYGTRIITELLKSTDQEFIIVTDSLSLGLPEAPEELSNYVFIGQSMYMSPSDVDRLIDFTINGNNVFLFCNYIPHNLMFYLYDGECEPSLWDDFSSFQDTAVTLSLTHPNLVEGDDSEYVYLSRYGTQSYKWRYFYPEYFCSNEGAFAELGRINNEYINFARVQYGDGYFYMHTTPLAFTNVNLLEEEAYNYARKVFSHMIDGPIYWDEYSRVPESVARTMNNRDGGGFNRNLSSKSPLQYILSQPALKWAWYLLLLMGLLFLVFRVKRRERVIPVLEPNTNTSLQFVRTIGRLYFLQNNHRKLALQKMKLFHIDVRENYGLHFQENDTKFEEKLAQKSGVSEEIINKVYLMYRNIKGGRFLSADALIDFYKAMAAFYKAGEVR